MTTRRTLLRRDVLRYGLVGTGALIVGGAVAGCRASGGAGKALAEAVTGYGPLGPPDAHGARVPAGFTCRVVARTGERPAAGSPYVWHLAPDGGACFPADDGGWIYVSNSEISPMGGVGALRFDRGGAVVDAYPILAGTHRNCAGGPTPWGTWLSCEEIARGQVWECDPTGKRPPALRAALGTFRHEAAAVDPIGGCVYLTEDEPDGRLYRFVATRALPDLTAGRLEVAQVSRTGDVRWHPVPDPDAKKRPTRRQVAASTPFDGGEGAWWHGGTLYFTTKGDDRVWALDCQRNVVAPIYDDDAYDPPPLVGVDNVTVGAQGEVLVAEDNGHMRIVAVPADGHPYPVVQIEGHRGSELCGPAFDPSGRRLYFSSQRGPDGRGVTFELTGPFRGLAG